MKTTSLLYALVTSILMAAPSYSATYYKWTDQAGTEHYASTPPKGVAYEKVTSQAPQSQVPSAEAQPSDLSTRTKPGTAPQNSVAPSAERKRATDHHCEALQKRLEHLQSGRRLRMSADDGSFRYLNEEEIRKETSATREALTKGC